MSTPVAEFTDGQPVDPQRLDRGALVAAARPQVLRGLCRDWPLVQAARRSQGDFAQAEKNAMKSFSLGPKVGSICAKNWQTVVEARTGMGDTATAQQATQRVKECRVKPIQRM